MALIKRWGWRASVSASLLCVGSAGYYITRFLTTPQHFPIFGEYYGLEGTAAIFLWYALGAMLVGIWLRLLSARLVFGTGIALAALVLNVAFSWTSGVFDRVLQLVPTWFPQQFVAEYLSAIQFPVYREAELDFYYLAWLGVLFALSMVFFRRGVVARLVHSLELASLVLIPLPVEVYLFDRQEFTIRVMDAQVHTPLVWFTNADMLGSLVASLIFLALLDNRLLGASGRPRPGRRDEGNASSRPIAREI